MTTQTATHTPGPWEVSQYGDDYGVYDPHRGNDIALVRGTGDDAETEANAHLIAAAPALLEALTELVTNLDSAEDAGRIEWPCSCSYDRCPYNLAHAAIEAASPPS
jgi:hypothetical protein